MRTLAIAFLLVLATTPIAGASSPALAADGETEYTVTGSAYTGWDDEFATGYWRHRYDVAGTESEAGGTIWEQYVDTSSLEGGYQLDVRAVIDVDCLEVDEETGEAWMGGPVVGIRGGVLFDDGTYVPWYEFFSGYAVYYVDDNRDNAAPDLHGDILIAEEWGTAGLTCHDRVAPWVADESQRGEIIVN